MGYRTQPDGGAKTLAELGLTSAAQQIDSAAAAVAAGNAAGGTVILDGEGKVPSANLPASGGTTLTITHGPVAGFKCSVTIQSSKAARQKIAFWISDSGTTGELSADYQMMGPNLVSGSRLLVGAWLAAGVSGSDAALIPRPKSGTHHVTTDATGKIVFELANVPEQVTYYVWADIGNGETKVSEAITLVE